MKKLVLLPVLALLSVSTVSFSSEIQLLQQGIQAVKQNDLEKASQIAGQLGAKGATRQSQALREQIAQAKLKKADEALAAVSAEKSELVDTMREIQDGLRTDIRNLRDDYRAALQDYDRVSGENLVLRTQLADAKNMLIELDAGIAEVKKKYEGYSDQIAQLNKELADQKAEHAKQLEQKDVSGEIARLNQKIEQLESENITTGDDLLQAREQIFQLNVKNETLKNNVKQLQDVLKVTDKQLEEKKQNVQKLENQIDTLLKEKNENENKLFKQAQEIDRLKKELDSAQAAIENS